MSELIDRQALLDECLNHYEVGNIEQNCTMDWICKTVRNFPAASPWHRVSDGLPKDGQCCLFFTVESGIPERDAWFGIYRNDWEGDINMRFDYWMPIEPPKEDA